MLTAGSSSRKVFLAKQADLHTIDVYEVLGNNTSKHGGCYSTRTGLCWCLGKAMQQSKAFTERSDLCNKAASNVQSEDFTPPRLKEVNIGDSIKDVTYAARVSLGRMLRCLQVDVPSRPIVRSILSIHLSMNGLANKVTF